MRKSPFVRHFPYVVGSAVAMAFCTSIHLPFSNPWNIVSELTQAHFNPTSNILRFLLFIFAPVLLLFAFRGLSFTRNLCEWGETHAAPTKPSSPKAAAERLWSRIMLSFLFCVIVALNTTAYHDSGPLLDAFHEGESIGTSMSLVNGGVPYKDAIFPHGLIQDPLRSLIAFKIFTQSIGAVRTLDSLLTLVCFLLMFAFLLVLYEGRSIWVNLTLIVLAGAIGLHGLIIFSRDLPTYLFLLVTAVLLRGLDELKPRLTAMRCVAFVLFSFLPLAAFMYSVDRGVYLTATYLVMLPLIVLRFRGRSLYLTLTLSAFGIGLAALFAGALLQWEWRPFVDYAILTVPQYWELMYGVVFPFRNPRYLLIVLILSWNAYWIFARFLTAFLSDEKGVKEIGAVRVFFSMHLMEICLLVMSLCFFRSALGRGDWEHVRYSLAVTYILFCYLIGKYWLFGALDKRPNASRILGGSLACIMVAACLAGGFRVGHEHLLARDFPLNVPDAQFIPADYEEGLSFLRANLSKDDEFLTMTSEASWYYLLNRPCPSRFSIALLAVPPQYQQEIVRDLEVRRVKIILYGNQSQFSNLDGISPTERLPIVYAYIRDHYRPYATIAGMEFWIRKT